MTSKTLKVDVLARVEGEGGVEIKIKDDKVTDVKFRIYEPPRFFEAFLRGRMYYEAPDITARICGICPIAYMMGSSQAMEAALGVTVEGQLRALRRLIYCGEWIESHALHMYMLHAPDFLGFPDAIALAGKFPDIVKQGLRLKKLGNDIMILIGGREIHPVNLRVGGFYKVPEKKDLRGFIEELKWARDAAIATIRLVKTFEFPEMERDYEFVALSHPDEYAIHEGHIANNRGLSIPVSDFENHYNEEHVAHSTSLHALHTGVGEYLVGPLARYAINYDQLTPLCKEEAKDAGLGRVVTNPFKSIVVRAVELLYCVEESLRLIEQYEKPDKPCVEIEPKRGTGCGCTEAPRGICYHRYRLDEKGRILDAKIMPPTSQNQKIIESDLRTFVPSRINLPTEKLIWQCEQAVRNYDPCISCSCHFLKLNIVRE